MIKKIHFVNLFRKHSRYFAHLVFHKFRLMRRYDWIKKNPEANEKVPPPLVYELVLTYRCNLHCRMCMLWGDVGWCKNEDESKDLQELSLGIVEKLFKRVGRSRPSFILSGGEPLLYSRFPDLANILNENRCFATICTNGILLDQFKGVIAHNPYLTFLISLDGIEGENDLIRGRGVYKKAIENIKLLKALKKPPYVGIQFTILPENVRNMYAFCRKMVSLGVDWILLNPAWFITDKQARDYECFLDSLFHVRAKTHLGYHFSYKIDTDEFSRQYSKIKNSRWPIQISCYLNNPAEDMHSYVNSGQFLSQNIFCYKQWVRLDILPSGEVAPCVRFPDLVFGDLHTQDILSIWNSTHFAEFRNIIMKNPLPVCNKCNSAYLYDARRKYL